MICVRRVPRLLLFMSIRFTDRESARICVQLGQYSANVALYDLVELLSCRTPNNHRKRAASTVNASGVFRLPILCRPKQRFLRESLVTVLNLFEFRRAEWFWTVKKQ